jgi:hypothetical protein
MAELSELVQSLPLPALLVFAFVLALIVGVRYLGLLQGLKASPSASESTAQVAAVIVDPTALTAAAAEVAGLAVAITEANVTGRAHTAATDRLGEKIDQLTAGIDDLRTEVIRSAAKLK